MIEKMPSPVFVYGNQYLSRNAIKIAQKKYSDAIWVDCPIVDDIDMDNVRMELGSPSWDNSTSVIFISEFPNRKAIREFLLSIARSCSEIPNKLVICDYKGVIKVNPKNDSLDKTWTEFFSSFNKIKDCKIVSNGGNFTEKESSDCVSFVEQIFEIKKIKISRKNILLLIALVGYDKGLLLSEIDKLCLVAPQTINTEFLHQHVFPTSKEAVLYKFGNALDSEDYLKCIDMMEQFIENGINENVLAEILVKKARWQMVISYYWSQGMSWRDITFAIMSMGKFPSSLWHSDSSNADKKKNTLDNYSDMVNYLCLKKGWTAKSFKKFKKSAKSSKKDDRKKNGETIPMSFMAEQAVCYVRDHIINPSKGVDDLNKKVVNRSMKICSICHRNLASIRYGESPMQALQEMIQAIKNSRIT